MEALRLTLRYIHLIGFALLLGGAIAQYLTSKFRINTAMLAGAGTQLVTGIALAAPIHEAGKEPDPAKLAVKAVLALLIFGAVFAVRKKPEIAKAHLLGIVGMTLINAAVAVFWR